MVIYSTKGTHYCYGTVNFTNGIATFTSYKAIGKLEIIEIKVTDIVQITE